jgi:predicted nucleotidyltransferase
MFGSRARGDHLKGSDYDILVIAEAFQDTNPVRRREALYQHWDGDEHADIIAYTPAEFDERSSKITVAREAKQDMVEI